MEEYNVRRGLFKGYVKRFYHACRSFDERLRARMDTLELKDKAPATGKDGSPASTKPSGSDIPRPVNVRPAKQSKSAKTKPKSAQAVVWSPAKGREMPRSSPETGRHHEEHAILPRLHRAIDRDLLAVPGE